MKKFTVRRKKWARGRKNGDPALRNDQECMCCLGFALNQISRIPMDDLNGGFMPQDTARHCFLTNKDDDGEITDNALAEKASVINDSVKISDSTREKKLKKLFRKHGVIVKFVD